MNQLSITLTPNQLLRERLLAEIPDLDEVTLADTIEGLSDLPELIAAILRHALLDEALAAGLKAHLGRMQERLQRIEERIATQRRIAREAMVAAALGRIAAPDFTAFIRTGAPGLVIVDEAIIPEPFWEPRAPRLNRQALLGQLKRGVEIPGVSLAAAEPVLSVRMQ
jgi:hypothetical protein